MDLYNLVLSAKITKGEGGGGGDEPTGTKEISITQNGVTTEDVKSYASAKITTNVSNSYAVGDEGKVVSNGALVAQTSKNVISNGTVDTTTNNQVVVNVPGITPTGTIPITQNGIVDVTQYASADVNVSGGGGGSDMILLTEKSLGNVSVISTSETVVGTVSFTSDTDYDMYIAVISRSEVQGNYHYATASMLLRIGTSNRATDGPGNTSIVVSNRWNCIANSNGTINTAQSGRGLYIGNLTRQGTETTLTIVGVYNSSGTRTINGEYSIQVYGINLYGLIG